MKSLKDNLYSKKKETIEKFEFNHEVASVFDDMLHRSIPFYRENLEEIVRLSEIYYQAGTQVYDLGCSHGNLSNLLTQKLSSKKIQITAVDSSQAMIHKIQERNISGLESVCEKIENIEFQKSSIIILNYTLQFVPLEKRDELFLKINEALCPGGVLLFSEKIKSDDETIDNFLWDNYRSFKLRQGYSDLEIQQKREALEEILIPETLEDHQNRLHKSRFKTFEVYLKYFNFVSLIAWK